MRRFPAATLVLTLLAAAGSARAGDPSTLANLAAWHKASGITGLADGAAVASWPDSSGNGVAATQATPANQPVYKASRSWANGRPSVRFAGNSVQNLLTNVPAVAAGSPYTCFATFYIYTSTGDQFANVVQTGKWLILNRAGMALDDNPVTTAYANTTTEPTGADPVPLTFAFSCDGTNSKIYFCGVDVSKSATNAYAPALQAGSTYGGTTTGTAVTMDLLEACWYTRALSPTEIATLQAYTLATYYPATGVAASFTTSSGASGSANATGKVALSPNFTVGGVGTIYGSLSAASTVVTPSDASSGTFSPATATLSNASPSATITYTPASAGPKTITPANDASLGAVSAYYGSTGSGTVARAYNDSGVLRSPYNHRDSGTFYESNNPGSYIRTTFGGTSISETFDFSQYTAVSQPAGDYPTLVWRVDGGAGGLGWQRQQLQAANTTFSYASGLAPGVTHNLERYFAGTNPGSLVASTLERWATPVASLRSTGWVLDAGFTLGAPAARPKRVLVLSDSIGEGWSILSTNNYGAAYQDASVAWPMLVANQLNWEAGVVAFGGTDYFYPGNGGVPAGTTEWPLYSAGRSRLVGGLLSPAPDYILIGWGTNNNGSSAAMTTGYPMLKALRTAAPSATIFLVVPYGLSSSAGASILNKPYSQAITVALYQQYAADFPSDSIYLIQPAVQAPVGLLTHYPQADHQRYASAVAQAITAATAVAPSARPRRPLFFVAPPPIEFPRSPALAPTNRKRKAA